MFAFPALAVDAGVWLFQQNLLTEQNQPRGCPEAPGCRQFSCCSSRSAAALLEKLLQRLTREGFLDGFHLLGKKISVSGEILVADGDGVDPGELPPPSLGFF